MLLLIRTFSFILLSAHLIVIHAAGFNCRKARHPAEQSVCHDPVLSKLDDQLNKSFNAAAKQSNNPKALRKQEDIWIFTQRNKCSDKVCLKKVYQLRIIELNQLAEQSEIITPTLTPVLEKTKTPVIKPDISMNGEYQRENEKPPLKNQSATLTILSLDNKTAKLIGDIFWLMNTQKIHAGHTENTFNLQNTPIHYRDNENCQFILAFNNNTLTISNDNGQCGGTDAKFNGDYKKVK